MNEFIKLILTAIPNLRKAGLQNIVIPNKVNTNINV